MSETTCPFCDKPGTIKCATCNYATYCSTDCQNLDSSFHRIICSPILGRDVRHPRPTPDHRLAIYFNFQTQYPQLAWFDTIVTTPSPCVECYPCIECGPCHECEADTEPLGVTNLLNAGAPWPIHDDEVWDLVLSGYGLNILARSQDDADRMNIGTDHFTGGNSLRKWEGSLLVFNAQASCVRYEVYHGDITWCDIRTLQRCLLEDCEDLEGEDVVDDVQIVNDMAKQLFGD